MCPSLSISSPFCSWGRRVIFYFCFAALVTSVIVLGAIQVAKYFEDATVSARRNRRMEQVAFPPLSFCPGEQT